MLQLKDFMPVNFLKKEKYTGSCKGMRFRMEKFEKDKEIQSDLYKELCNLLSYMKKNIERFPKFKAFLWTLKSRNILAEEHDIELQDKLEEQAKLINSFLKLAYWY